MGAWSVSITENDTAADLRYEYEAAFSRLPPEAAVERLDAYVRRELDGDSWPDYVYSLALFLWKHGLLTENVRIRALDLIGREAGLELYTDASQRRKREKVLADFREKLCGPQPPPKPVRLRVNQKPVFHTGTWWLCRFLRPEGLTTRTRICRKGCFIWWTETGCWCRRSGTRSPGSPVWCRRSGTSGRSSRCWISAGRICPVSRRFPDYRCWAE